MDVHYNAILHGEEGQHVIIELYINYFLHSSKSCNAAIHAFLSASILPYCSMNYVRSFNTSFVRYPAKVYQMCILTHSNGLVHF